VHCAHAHAIPGDFDPEEPALANMSSKIDDPLPEQTDSESDEEQMVTAPL